MTDSESPPVRKPVRIDFLINTNGCDCLEVLKAGTAAFGLFVACGLWSNRTDRPGFVPGDVAADYGGRYWDEWSSRLESSGLWRPVPGGWEMVAVAVPLEPLFRFRPVYRREPIPEELRAAVMQRDNHACVECSATDDLTLDHIRPWSLGGPDTYSNLRVLCRSCNSSKGAKYDSDDPAQPASEL